MLFTGRISDILSVLRVIDRVGGSFNLIRVDTLLDEEFSDIVSSSLSKVTVVLL